MTQDVTTPGPTPLDAGQRALAVGLVLSVTLVAFETTAVLTALPTIADELDGLSLYGATIAAYMLADLVALVWAGEWADRYGVRRPFVVCISIFIVGLIVAASAQSMVIVLVGRLLQGAGSGAFAPLSSISVRRAFPEDRQSTMYAWLSAGWVLPSLLAPAIAGVVTDRFGWRWVFIGIIPLAVFVAVLTARSMARIAAPVDTGKRRPTQLPRAFQIAIGVGLIAVGVQNRFPPVAIGVTVLGVAVALPALRQLLPAGVFTARRGLPAVIAVRFLATATFLGVDSFIPLAADRIHGARPIVQGSVIAGAALTWTIGQAFAARHRAALPVDRAARIGFMLLLIGICAVAPVLVASWPLWLTFFAWAIGGFGMGILFNPTTMAAMSGATDGHEGEVGSQLHLADTVGFGIMSVIGGATVAFSDRSSLTLQAAIGINFCLAALCAITGIAASRRTRAIA